MQKRRRQNIEVGALGTLRLIVPVSVRQAGRLLLSGDLPAPTHRKDFYETVPHHTLVCFWVAFYMKRPQQPRRRRRPRRTHPPSPTAGKHMALPADVARFQDVEWGLDPICSENVPTQDACRPCVAGKTKLKKD